MAAVPHQTREFVTRGEIERQAQEAREADSRAELSRDAALGRLADAVRDCRALGLADAWRIDPDTRKVRVGPTFSGETGHLHLVIPDPARAERLRDLIHGAD